jgi:Nif11 domain
MSIQAAAAFFDQALSDTGLQQKIIAAAASAEDAADKAEAVTKLGQSMGFEFTPTEAIELRAAARKSMIDRGSTHDELDELDLQVVTGGISIGGMSVDNPTLISKAGGMVAGRMIPTGGVPGAGITVSFFSAGIAVGIANAMNGGGAAGFFTGFGDGSSARRMPSPTS